jgi:Breast carcinoma amplified sequence 2 (BCAS2)
MNDVLIDALPYVEKLDDEMERRVDAMIADEMRQANVNVAKRVPVLERPVRVAELRVPAERDDRFSALKIDAQNAEIRLANGELMQVHGGNARQRLIEELQAQLELLLAELDGVKEQVQMVNAKRMHAQQEAQAVLRNRQLQVDSMIARIEQLKKRK